MNKYPLIGGSVCAVVLIVLASLTNVVGYQTVQASNQKIINEEVNQKELLFQTIVDMANNKEIQKIIIGSELISKRSLDSNMKFCIIRLTKGFLNFAYQIGMILLKTISKSKIQSILKQCQASNPGMQKEISTVIERDTTLKSEMNQLQSLSCDCENDNTTRLWHFPVICILLTYLAVFIWPIVYRTGWGENFLNTIFNIMQTLDCRY